MRIATLQFSPTLGDVERNIARADALIKEAGLRDRGVDLLVGPELGFTGYNFPSLAHITPYLEPTAAGPTARWAFTTAKRLGCVVSVGYPERATAPAATVSTPGENGVVAPMGQGNVEEEGRDGSGNGNGSEGVYNYNATLTVGPDGQVLAHYRKTHLYYTDETWALPSPEGWLTRELPLPPHTASSISSPPSTGPTTAPTPSSPSPAAASAPPALPTTTPQYSSTTSAQNTLTTAFGICMDLNPHLFLAPWHAYEFATHARASRARLVVCSMAWLSRLSAHELGLGPTPSTPSGPTVRPADLATTSQDLRTAPDTATLSYWLERLSPLIAAPWDVVVVLANRCGIEPGGWTPATSSVSSTAARPRFPRCARFDGEGGEGGESGEVEVETGEGAEEVRYAGSSCVVRVGQGRVRVLGVMGRGVEGVGVVDVDLDGGVDVEDVEEGEEEEDERENGEEGVEGEEGKKGG